MAIEDDLRFLSHHDVMRAVERIAARAELPVRFSQGFNPRPGLSLPCPRPVGVASRSDLLVIALEQDIQDPSGLLKSMNAHAPAGMRFLRARMLESRRSPQPERIDYELDIPPQAVASVAQRLCDLQARPQWDVERTGRGEAAPPERRSLDLRPLVADIGFEDEKLTFSLAPRGDVWARPSEMLRLLGLDARADLARLTRRSVEYRF